MMVIQNKTRLDYYETFKEMINEYNTGSASATDTYNKLLEFVKDLNTEDQRSISEGLTEEELAIFDLLTKPQVDLTERDRMKVKNAAKDLLQILKTEKLVLDWRKHQPTKSDVKVTIEKVLDQELPDSYDKLLFDLKAQLVFQHVYDSYFGAGRSVYGYC
jgi:type I restriction enzyme R subunit